MREVLSMDKSMVSIARCENPYDFEKVSEAVSRSLAAIGGLESLVTLGDTVILKPNVLCAMDYRTGAVTNPHVVRSLCRMLKRTGAGKIYIAEGSTIGCDTHDAFEKSGYAKLAMDEKAELIDLKKAPSLFMGIPNGKIFRRIEIPEIIMKADVIINVPVMKTHDMIPATLGLKNMKGVLRDKDKKRFHVWGLSQSIVDLNKLVLPQITVIDGTIAMEGLGPIHGRPVNLGLVVSSFDTVAADTVAACIMGIDPAQIDHVQLAAQQGLGISDLSNIEVVGMSIESVRRPFEVLHVDYAKYENELGIEIHESGACSGCRKVMNTLLNNHLKGNYDVLKNRTLIFGQTVKIPHRIKGKLLNFGSCTKKYKNRGEYIPGCPPMQEHVLEYFGMDPNTWND
jgi:uncharacterized protein (DUF362 family)